MEQKKLQFLVNNLTKNGKKETALKLLSKTFQMVEKRPFPLLEKVIQLSNPLIKLRSLTKSGLTRFQIVPLSFLEQEKRAVRHFLKRPSSLSKGLPSFLSNQMKDPTVLLKTLQDWLRQSTRLYYKLFTVSLR